MRSKAKILSLVTDSSVPIVYNSIVYEVLTMNVVCVQDEMTKFHSDDYIKFLRSIRPDNMGEYSKLLQRFNVGEDCPVFDGQ